MEFSNTNPEYKSLAEIRKEAYEQGRADQKAEDNEFFNFEGTWRLEKQKIKENMIKEFIEWLDSNYDFGASIRTNIVNKLYQLKEQK